MIRTTVTVMGLLLLRDRPTLVLLFVLPPLVFIVLTAVFRESVTRIPDVTVATIGVETEPGAGQLASTLAHAQGLKIAPPAADLAELRNQVSRGEIEVGVVAGRQEQGAAEWPRWTLLVAPGHESAAQITRARILTAGPEGHAPGEPSGMPAIAAPVIETVGSSRGDPIVLDEASAIAAMFLMLAGIQVAATLVDERESGIYDRVAGSGSVVGLVLGKFVFGVLIGTAQAALIMATAATVFHVEVLAAPARLAIACGLSAALATSLTLLVAACCSTRQQALAISTFGVLVLSTLGGSMVPLRFMPDWLARIGRFTPNAWSIDAFRDAMSGGPDWRLPHPSWAVIACLSLAALTLAISAYRRQPVL